MNVEHRKVAIYSRKSKYTGKGESIGNQIELCRDYLRMHMGEEAAANAIVFEDEGFSGGNLDRPSFKQMMEAVKAHKISSIVVYRLDRISRNIGDFAGLINELTSLNVDFISINEHFDTQTPMGRAMMYIASVFSQLERETIAERIRDNMHELAKTGRWLGGVTPLGYRSEGVENVTVDGKKKKAYRLVPVDEELEVVRTIYELFLQNHSLTATETEMLKRRITTKRGNEFTRFSIKSILQNPVYMMADEAAYQYFIENVDTVFAEQTAFDGTHGILAYNRTDQQKGRTTIYKPIDQWIITVGGHPGLIPGGDWIAIQKLLEQNKSKAYRRPRNNQALLTGLIYCSCGSRMYPKLTKRFTPEGEAIYSYVCRHKERSKGELCNQRNVTGNLIDKAVVEELRYLEENGDAFRQQLEQSKKFYTGDREQYEQQLEELRRKHGECEKKMQSLMDSLAEAQTGSIRQRILDRVAELDRETSALQERIQELEHLAEQEELNDSEFDLLVQLLSLFDSAFDTLPVEQKRTAIQALVRKVIWDGESAHVVLFGAEEGDIAFSEIADGNESATDGGSVPLLGDDSKRDPDVFSCAEEMAGRRFSQ